MPVLRLGLLRVPNTISDQHMASLRRRAEKANTESMFSRRNVTRRLASNDQRRKALGS